MIFLKFTENVEKIFDWILQNYSQITFSASYVLASLPCTAYPVIVEYFNDRCLALLCSLFWYFLAVTYKLDGVVCPELRWCAIVIASKAAYLLVHPPHLPWQQLQDDENIVQQAMS